MKMSLDWKFKKGIYKTYHQANNMDEGSCPYKVKHYVWSQLQCVI